MEGALRHDAKLPSSNRPCTYHQSTLLKTHHSGQTAPTFRRLQKQSPGRNMGRLQEFATFLPRLLNQQVSRMALHTKVILCICLHCAHRSPCVWDLDYDTNRQQQAWRLRLMVSQEAMQRLLDWPCDKCQHSTSHLTRAPELSCYKASPWLVRSCHETGPAVRHITSALWQDTAQQEMSEGQTMLSMGLHGSERPLPLQLRNFHCPEEGGRQSKLEEDHPFGDASLIGACRQEEE